MAPNTTVPFGSFISDIRRRVRSVFQSAGTVPDSAPDSAAASGAMVPGQRRDVLNKALEQIAEQVPLSVFIPARFGGRGQHVHECLSLLEACSYESLPLSLIMGINGALFLQPVSRHAHDDLQRRVFHQFLNDRALGGLMITEPDYGSDALSMRTSFLPEGEHYRLRGIKHWGGLTGHADYWLLTARGVAKGGELERNISFFVWDRSLGGIEVEEYYRSLGLAMIPYGRNVIDTRVPADRKLAPQTSGVRVLLDLLHRSRLQFPGMAMGFLKRLLDEALAHTRSRKVGGRSLGDYDQVQDRLAELQSSYTLCSAMCAFTSGVAGVENDCSTAALPANAIKSVITDKMQSAAQSLLQLVGAKGYRLDHIAARSVVDSRPFQIFEGSNDILYQQISEAVLKAMDRVKETNLARFLQDFDLTARAATLLSGALNVTVDLSLPQRKLVELGRALGRVITLQMVVDLGSRGFRSDLIDNSVSLLRREIGALFAGFADRSRPLVVEDYEDGSSWLSAISDPA